MDAFSQHGFEVRFEWGLRGLERLGPISDVVVIVDVLSFSTAVEIAVSQGARVYPYRHGDESAVSFAQQKGAALAVSRLETDAKNPYSLSPRSLGGLAEGESIVLPSPNGATLSLVASLECEHVLAGCLRNAGAVGRASRAWGKTIAVIAAGEQWKGTAGGLRPAFEDLVGAGAILGGLPAGALSPEAVGVAGAFRAAEKRLEELLGGCASGCELAEIGFREDVLMAARLDVSVIVPRLAEGAFFGGT